MFVYNGSTHLTVSPPVDVTPPIGELLALFLVVGQQRVEGLVRQLPVLPPRDVRRRPPAADQAEESHVLVRPKRSRGRVGAQFLGRIGVGESKGFLLSQEYARLRWRNLGKENVEKMSREETPGDRGK